MDQVRACVFGLGSGIITSISSFGYGRSSTLPTTLPRAGVTHASPETSMGGASGSGGAIGGGGGEAGGTGGGGGEAGGAGGAGGGDGSAPKLRC